ncbi:transcriptional regulator [Corynebacterium macginleyi]|uniref:helix-turn-helix transcriptional regulator n=1 Tax=Corynebacterium macginleyi TaxID=38290 RepID=UPI00190D000A|nr:transcriptional regulator [Corynebacterium macginleyi]
MLQLMNLSSSHAPEENFLEQYIPLVDFLGQAMGPNTEIVLHDLDVPDKSIIGIANGHISGRELGGPVTDFALWFMKQGDAAAVPMMTGYRAVNGEGKVCRSSSYFLRDATGHMRGMLCINVELSELIQIRDAADTLIGGTEAPALDKAKAFGGYPGTTAPPKTPALEAAANKKPEEPYSESLRSNVEHLLDSMLDSAISTHSTPVTSMQRHERLEVIATLEDDGFFLLKGGIAAAAARLGVSEPTVYRYLVQVRG